MRLELTRRGDYAVRAMLLLSQTAPVVLSADRIADEMGIPARFLREALGDLNRAGLVEAVIGRSGGYRLARPASEISLLDIIEAVEGDSRRQTCVLRGAPCGLDGFCNVHAVFFEAQQQLLDRFSGTTLSALPDRGRRAIRPS